MVFGVDLIAFQYTYSGIIDQEGNPLWTIIPIKILVKETIPPNKEHSFITVHPFCKKLIIKKCSTKILDRSKEMGIEKGQQLFRSK